MGGTKKKAKSLAIKITLNDRHSTEKMRPGKVMNGEEIQSFKNGAEDVVKKNKNLTLPMQIVQSGLRVRRYEYMRKGYHRYTQQAIPHRDNIELTDDDLIFVKNQAEKYRFHGYYLLNSDRLLSIYSLFKIKTTLKAEKDKLKQILCDYLLDREQCLTYSLFELLKTENLPFFGQYVSMLVNRWLYRNNQGHMFALNTPNETPNPILPYSLINPNFKQQPNKQVSSTMKMRIYLHKQVEEVNTLIKEHQEIKNNFENRKTALLQHFIKLMEHLKLIEGQGLPFREIDINSEMTLETVDKSLFVMIGKLNQWRNQHPRQQIQPKRRGRPKKRNETKIKIQARKSSQKC